MVRVMRVVGWLALCVCVGAGAQERLLLPTITRVDAAPGVVGAPDKSVGGALRSLAARAGVVFVGQVVGIERKGGVVEVHFRVLQTVQGAVGETYTLREWAGLWSAGQQRYAVGQRSMLFLRAANAAGLSSPVDGMEGVVPLVPMGANAAPLLDVRRMATRVERAVGKPILAEAVALPDAVASLSTAGVEPAQQRLPEGWRPMPVMLPGRYVELGARPDAR